MSPRNDHLIKPDRNHHHQSPHKQIRGSNERRSRLLHSPQIHYRQQNQHHQTQSQRVRQQRRHCRYQRSNSRRNPHRHIQQVIDHQRRARQQPSPAAQVFARNRVRSPAIRIRRDRLPITEINDRQQRDHRKRQRHHISDPNQSQRQQNRQSRLRTVCRRTQSIQPKCRDPLRSRNPLPRVLRRSQRPPEHNVNQSHIPSHRAPGTLSATITKSHQHRLRKASPEAASASKCYKYMGPPRQPGPSRLNLSSVPRHL